MGQGPRCVMTGEESSDQGVDIWQAVNWVFNPVVATVDAALDTRDRIQEQNATDERQRHREQDNKEKEARARVKRKREQRKLQKQAEKRAEEKAAQAIDKALQSYLSEGHRTVSAAVASARSKLRGYADEVAVGDAICGRVAKAGSWQASDAATLAEDSILNCVVYVSGGWTQYGKPGAPKPPKRCAQLTKLARQLGY